MVMPLVKKEDVITARGVNKKTEKIDKIERPKEKENIGNVVIKKKYRKTC